MSTKTKRTIIDPVLRRADAQAFTGLSDTQFEEKVANGELPQPFKVTDSGRTVAWLRKELEDWLAARVKKRDEELKTSLTEAKRTAVAKKRQRDATRKGPKEREAMVR